MTSDFAKSGTLRPALILCLIVLVNFFWFPGHTWLQSDTQIYAPIFEHLEDPATLRHDLAATRPHVSFTIYDEAAIALHRLTGLGYKAVLHAQQVIFRLCGIGGVYLIAASAGLPPAGALFAAAAFGLGAVVNGPAVLTFEYEPVPRGFAVMLIFAALGCISRGWWPAAGAFALLATIYHPTTTAPLWGCLAVWFFWRAASAERRILLISAGASAVLLVLLAKFQSGPIEPQPLFGRIDPALETLQRLRGAYNWIGLWPRDWLWQYPLLFAFVVLAWRRIGANLNPVLRFLSLALPIYGVLMIPVTWFLLDRQKWILMPQFQPARAVLFITAFAMILGVLAAWYALAAKRTLEAGAWLALVFILPLNGLVVELFTGLPDRLHLYRLGLLLSLAAATVFLLSWSRRFGYLVLLAIALPVILIPTAGQVTNYPGLHTPGLHDLAAWARAHTKPDDIFLFADAHRHLAPGIFRAQSRRALYVDWKTGGQVNILPELGREWGRRWQAVNEARPPLLPLDDYRALGIHYLVVSPMNLPPDTQSVYANTLYAVVRLP